MTLTRPSLLLSMEVCSLIIIIITLLTHGFILLQSHPAIQSGSLTRMLTFTPETSSMCIDFPVDDDDIALEDPEEFIWIIDPIPIPRVELSTNTTRVIIIDDDRKLICVRE